MTIESVEHRARPSYSKPRQIIGDTNRWMLAAIVAGLVFAADLAVVESNWLFDEESWLRDRIFDAFRHALPFDTLPYLRALVLIGVVPHPYRTVALLLSLVVLASVLLLLGLQRARGVMLLLVAMGGAVALAALTKEIVARPGVTTAGGHTFPSGHAVVTVAFLGSWMYILQTSRPIPLIRHIALALIALIFAVATLSILSFHYPSEVLAGYSLGCAWLAGLIAYLERWLRKDLRSGTSSPNDKQDHLPRLTGSSRMEERGEAYRERSRER